MDNSNYSNETFSSGKDNAIDCRDVCLKAKKKKILDQVSFGVPRGSITGLLGPNGAGKSSLLRMIAGLSTPDSGSIHVLGEPAGEAVLGKLSLLPDRGNLPGWLTAGKWLSFAQSLYPDWNDTRAEQLIVSLKINLESRISVMSRGEEARLQLLTCLARSAPLVILDEPFTGVDMISREQISSTVVSELADGERTFLIATHDIREMELLFDRLVLIKDGQVQSVADVEQLRRAGKSVESHYREVFA
ncbi:ABC transporter ATP-binding protein [Cohnella abietis]|uniref:ABC transporter n=1 Tax=Cohnella abietis TaxID=2507935 RepID=A0A3T1DBF2_9BACL|nr:ABC transporter ATP-binding protein [Cohnella abietis]BBI35419.1 ABC transporter [Cohnella abietis]